MDIGSIISITLSAIYLLLIVSTMIVVLSENSNPTKTIVWLLVLIFIPAIGLVFYYFFGYNPRRIGKTDERFTTFMNALLLGVREEHIVYFDTYNYKEEILPSYIPLVNLLEGSNRSCVFKGSDVEIITNGKRKFDALITDLENACHHIHMEYFYFRKDSTGKQIREILMRKAAEGVKVRFIYENIANIDIAPKYYNEMKSAGIEVLPFSKVSLSWIRRNLNYRDHRKIVVIDGKIGYTGGMNIGDDYSKKWRDTHLRILGQGVYGLQINFLHVWFESGGTLPKDLQYYFPVCEQYSDNLLQVVPEAPDSSWPYLLLATVKAVENAKKYVYIQTPYYMPSDTLLAALKSAALSGVDVRIMVSHKSDIFFMDPATHSYYEESLRAGIRIYELHDVFSHAKSMLVDDYLSIIGTANLDFRSLELSFEINTYMYDAELAKRNYDIFFEDMKKCKEVLLEDWLKRPWWKKLIQSVMRLFSPLL